MRTEAARARSIDSVLAEHPGQPVQLVKLDVDGFECDVLRGASRMLSTMRPIFVMELAPYVLEERGASLDELLSFFHPNGYRFYDERTNKPLPKSADELQQMIANGEGINAIARAVCTRRHLNPDGQRQLLPTDFWLKTAGFGPGLALPRAIANPRIGT